MPKMKGRPRIRPSRGGNYPPPLDTPRGYLELPIKMLKPDDLPPRPKHTRGSKNILGKIWAAKPHVAILPHDFLVPTEEERRKAAKREAREKKEARRQYCRDYRAKNLERERQRKREAARKDKQDPVKREKRRISYTKYNRSAKGKAKRREYEEKINRSPERREKRNRWLREKYASDETYREKKRAESRLRDTLHPPTRAQKDRRNARRRERYANEPEYRDKQKAQAKRAYERKHHAEISGT